MNTSNMLETFARLCDEGMNAKNTVKVFKMIGIDGYDEKAIDSFVLWSDCLPIADDMPYTPEQRNLHILWESIDRVPLGINVAFAIPFRQIIAKHLFKKCGDGFIANEGCRFNYGHNIEVGKNVAWNHCCYFDSKGSIKFEDYSMITEYTKIFTHSHSESDHIVRSYAPVVIGEHAKVYTNCTVLPGVTIGKGAIVATGSVVTKSVDDFTLVAGIPAKPVRQRKTDGNEFFNHYTLKNNMFQV